MKNLISLDQAIQSAIQLYETLQIDPEGLDLLKRKHTVVRCLSNNLKTNTFNISVIGTMKSGKSTFVNALLGIDLMPNETQACTLVPTKVRIDSFTKKVLKYKVDGAKETLKGGHVAQKLHEDIKYQRQLLEQGKPIDVQYYETSHPLAKATVGKQTQLILTDTPGPNEMKLFQVSQFDLEETFLQSLYDTSYLFFIIDLQYFKDEENVKLIEAIKRYRPELIEHMIFIINKIDRLTTTKDVTLEQTIQDVEKTLISWGIQSPHILAVSSKKALYSRLVEKSLKQSLFHKIKNKVWKVPDELEAIQEDLEAILPMQQVEIAGEQLYKKATPEEAYEQLFEQSNFDELEQFLVEYIIPESKVLHEEIAQAQFNRERQWLTELIEQHVAVIDKSIESVQLDSTLKQVVGLEMLLKKLNDFQFDFSKYTSKKFDYDSVYSYLKDRSYYSGYRSSLTGMSADTSWSKYRLDDYEWMDPDESSAGREKEHLQDFYDYKMNEFLSTLKQAKFNYQNDWLSQISKAYEEEMKRFKSDLKNIIKKYDVDFNFYLDDTLQIPLKQHFSVYKFSTPSGLYIEQKTEYKERAIFKGRGDIKYSSFRLTGLSDFKSTCKEYLELTLEAAVKETLNDIEEIVHADQLLEYARAIENIQEQLQIKMDKFAEQKLALDDQLSSLNTRKQAFLHVLEPFVEEPIELQEYSSKKTSVKNSVMIDEFDKFFGNQEQSLNYLNTVLLKTSQGHN